MPDLPSARTVPTTVPARTPQAIIERLQREVAAIVVLPDVRTRLADQGLEPIGSEPASFGAFIRAETVRYARIVRLTGARID